MKINSTNFKRLIGIWKTSGEIVKDNSILDGTDSYEFILDGNFILHKANVKMGKEKSETVELISIDNSSGKASMQYFNSKGERGLMSASLTGNDFRIEGEGLKFIGTINDENSELTGKWYLQAENQDWTEFINLKLQKESTL
ncbi:hypothetical protein CAP36_00630 [Chitinophagaceae bacterium IBVUCB2]|nr:hypothetical protein CAP36_00630 [Chitinophagaceae bacterium IBVUCB2]